MRYTEHYELNQWAETDRILMEDFNADNTKIDTALAAHAAKLADCGNCGITVASYTGTGTYGTNNPNVVDFPKKPAFFMIRCVSGLLFGTAEDTSATFLGSAGTFMCSSCTTSWAGNRLSFYGGDAAVQMNRSGMVYRVIAFYAEDAK